MSSRSLVVNPPSKEELINKNVVILTSGLTGSSVIAGLIARGSYWTGFETVKKEYDTHENIDLVRLNGKLLRESGYSGRYEREFRGDLLEDVEALGSTISDRPYREFLEECNRHQPWVWKDPRLWLTIRYWNHLLDWDRCLVIVLTRSVWHIWVSATLRRQIQSYESLKKYEKSIENSILGFLDKNRIGYLHVTYEQLIGQPEETIDKLNTLLGSRLSIYDLKSFYTGELHKTPRNSPIDFFKAILIYLKNYSERWDRNRNRG
jgi:hypothetical protein